MAGWNRVTSSCGRASIGRAGASGWRSRRLAIRVLYVRVPACRRLWLARVSGGLSACLPAGQGSVPCRLCCRGLRGRRIGRAEAVMYHADGDILSAGSARLPSGPLAVARSDHYGLSVPKTSASAAASIAASNQRSSVSSSALVICAVRS